jgi:hypothetical protein
MELTSKITSCWSWIYHHGQSSGRSAVSSLGNWPRSSNWFLLWQVSELLAERFVHTVRQLILHKRYAATNRQPLNQEWQCLQRFEVYYWPRHRPGPNRWKPITLGYREGPCTLKLVQLREAADKFAGASLTRYLQAVDTRETNAIHALKPPKQIALFCGPRLYQPDTEKKLTALA